MNSKVNYTTVGGFDSGGKGLTDPKDAIGVTYEACTAWCGSEQEPFDWEAFSQQFSSWLLPWLALIFQLPFGAEYSLDNLISRTFPSRPLRILLIFLLSCTSPHHDRVPRPRGILAHSNDPQHSLGPQPLLGHQPPQSPEYCQGSRLPPTSSNAYHAP